MSNFYEAIAAISEWRVNLHLPGHYSNENV